MGMDIYGLNPTITGDKPGFPDNFRDLSQKAQDYYWELDKEWDDNNPGYYFRANIWSWRVIHALCDAAISKYELDMNTEGWGHNSGHGLKITYECYKLADALEDFVESMDDNKIDRIGINMGMWTIKSENGYSFKELDEADRNTLDILYPGVIDRLPIEFKTKSGEEIEVYPSHHTDIDHLKEFINFLRNCNGFEII